MKKETKKINLALEGGGVRGFGLVGALQALENDGYTFNKVAGTSAGSIVASLVAAGYTAKELEKAMHEIDFNKFADEGVLDKFGIVGKSSSLLLEKGVYEGKYINKLITDLLAAKNVKTFGDLKISDSNPNDIKSQYKLVILATDVTRGRLVRLPWDYMDYGLNPDDQPIASAVQASTAIPFYYEPARIGKSFVVDGGLISNFPIWIFESGQHDHNKKLPTIGVKLSAKPEALSRNHDFNTKNTFVYSYSILRTILSAQDQIHLDDPCTISRTIFVDSSDVKSTDFNISKDKKDLLYNNGLESAQEFLDQWNFDKFLKNCPAS